jgi:hypothetical protein
MNPPGEPRPRLTIAIPTVDRSALVGRAVESALAQDVAELEILVSNNGSTDGTRGVLDRFRDPRLRVLHREPTIPAWSHGNVLVSEARGEFFLGLSDDDWLEPGIVGAVLALLDRHSGLSFVYTGCDVHYGDVAVPARTGPEVEEGLEFLARFLAGEREVCWCACVMRTSDMRRIGPIPEGTICGDMFFWTALAAEGPVGCIPLRLSHYVAYLPAVANSSRGTPVEAWTAEVRSLVGKIVSAVEAGAGDRVGREGLRRDAREFLARSLSGQFVWNAVRGASRAELLRAFGRTRSLLRRSRPENWIRLLGALAAPRALLHRRILLEASRKRGALRVHGPGLSGRDVRT